MGSGATVNAVGGTAIGQGATVNVGATGAVAIGQGSVATDPNTVSFGSPGNERRLTNVAPGIAGTDAVNLDQLQAVQSRDMAYTHSQVQRAYGGVAMAFALTAVSPTLAPGEQAVSGGAGYFKGESGFSFRYVARPSDRWFLGAGMAVSGLGDVGGSAGVGYKW